MSEPTPPPAPQPPPEPAPAPAAKKKVKRTWAQRLKLTVLAIAIVVVLFRIALNLLLPTVIRKVANAFDLDCAYNRIDLSTLGGNAQIWGFSLRPKTGGDSIVNADYVQGTISPLNLLRGRLVVYRAEVDGVDVLIDREPNGAIPLLKTLAASSKPKPATAAPPAKNSVTPINLEPPLRIDAIRLTHVSTRLRDRSISPPFEATIQTTVRISNVGSMQQPARFELEVAADPVLDTLLVQGEVHNTPTSLDGAVNVLLRGIHPRRAAAYLIPLGLRPVANDITVRARMSFKAAVIPNTPDLSANLSVEGISAIVDGEEWAGLDKVSVNARKLNATTVELGQVLLEGARASARRTPSGGVRVAGIELAPVAASNAQPPAAANQSPAGFRLVLDELRLKNLEAIFDDQAVEPAGKLAARLDAMTVKNLVFDTAHPGQRATIAGSASLPGVIHAIEFSGFATPSADKRHLDLKLIVDGIKPDALAPYLAHFGIESELRNGHFEGNLSADLSEEADGRLSADAGISGIRFGDDRDLFSMGAAKIGGFTLEPKSGAIKVALIELSGPLLAVRREASGNFASLGLRTRARQAAHVAPAPARDNSAPAPVTTRPVPAQLPRIEIGKFSWKDVKLQFNDETARATSSVSIGDAGIEASDLVIDPQAKSQGRPGRFHAWISAPKLANRLDMEGTVAPAVRGMAIDSKITGTGITAEAIAPYLKMLGVVPVLGDGRLNLNAKATVAMLDDGLSSSLDLQNVTYKDGQTELAGIDALHVSELAMRPSGIEVGEVRIDRPRADARRNADGSLQLGGVRLVSIAPASQPAATAPSAPVGFAPAMSSNPLKLPPSPIMAALKALHVHDGSITWTDDATPRPVKTTIFADADVNNLRLGPPDASPATLNVTARIDGVIDKATISGTLSVAPEAPGADLKIVADGIRAGELAAYLPAGVSTTLKDGHFSGALKLAMSNHPAGGLTAHLLVNDIDFHDAPDTPLFKLDSFEIAASRLDPGGGTIAIDTIASKGLEADVQLGSDGAISAAGIRLANDVTPTTRPVAVSKPPEPSAATEPAIDLKAMIEQARKPLPMLTIGKIDLAIKRLSVAGATGPGAAPISLEDAQIRSSQRIETGGRDTERREPVSLEVTGRIAPVIGSFAVTVDALPMAVTPTLKLDLKASDINGRGLTDLLPQLKPTIDGTGLTRGTFHSHIDAMVNYGRRGPRDLDFVRGFTLDVHIKPVELKSEPDGPVVAGLEEIRSDGIKVEPKTGNVRIKSIEITKPVGRITRDAKGIHAFGLLIKSAAPPAQSAAPVSQPLAAAPAPTPVSRAAASVPARPTSEIRLDRLLVSGIDVVVQDTTSTPNTLVPLNGLDVDVREISNQMPFDGKPLKFSVLLTSDKVPLPYRKGAAGSTPAATQPAATGPALDSRELFSQITANGKVAIKRNGDHFALDGWAKTSVNGFELLGVSGLAKEHKVTIGGGIFDDANDIRFNPTGNIDTRNSLVLTNLSLSEPAHGPIQTALKIGAPIDVAIGLITDPDDSITLNLPVPIKNGTVSADDVMGPALGAVAGVLTTAIASAPVKAVAGVGNLLGLGGSQKPVQEETIALRFLPGYTALDANSAQILDLLSRRMRKESTLELQLRHQLSAADVARAAIRANPTPDECRSLAERLRLQKGQLLAQRATLAGTARGELGTRSDSRARTTLDSLQSVDRQIAQIENALDQLYDQLRPGAARQADRRTRAASLQISHRRLAVVREALLAAGIKGADERIHQANPQFASNDSAEGGQIVVTLVPKKK